MAFIGAKPTNVPLTSADIQDGTVALADLSATGTKDATTFLRGDNTFAEAGGGNNTPFFYGELASHQTITRNTAVKITGMTNDEVDSNSAFDGTTFTVPSGEGGKYYISGSLIYDFELAGDDGFEVELYIYKNGSSIKNTRFRNNTTKDLRYVTLHCSGIFTLSAGNTIELYTQSLDNSGDNARALSNQTSIGGYKLIE